MTADSHTCSICGRSISMNAGCKENRPARGWRCGSCNTVGDGWAGVPKPGKGPEKLTAADLRARLAAPKGAQRVKGTVPTIVDGIRFDSKREARRWGELRLLQAAGEIRDLERQVPVDLQGQDGPILTDTGRQARRYVADFRYFDERLNIWVIEDAKGHPTEVFKLKRAILAAQGIEVKEI